MQHHIVPIKVEPGRQGVVERGHGAGDVEDPLATPAPKVMVVVLPRKFVAGGLAGEVHRHQPPFVEQGADVPVHRRNAESSDIAPRVAEDLGGREWPTGALKCPPDGTTLSGLSFHATSAGGGRSRGDNTMLGSQ